MPPRGIYWRQIYGLSAWFQRAFEKEANLLFYLGVGHYLTHPTEETRASNAAEEMLLWFVSFTVVPFSTAVCKLRPLEDTSPSTRHSRMRKKYL